MRTYCCIRTSGPGITTCVADCARQHGANSRKVQKLKRSIGICSPGSMLYQRRLGGSIWGAEDPVSLWIQELVQAGRPRLSLQPRVSVYIPEFFLTQTHYSLQYPFISLNRILQIPLGYMQALKSLRRWAMRRRGSTDEEEGLKGRGWRYEPERRRLAMCIISDGSLSYSTGPAKCPDALCIAPAAGSALHAHPCRMSITSGPICTYRYYIYYSKLFTYALNPLRVYSELTSAENELFLYCAYMQT